MKICVQSIIRYRSCKKSGHTNIEISISYIANINESFIFLPTPSFLDESKTIGVKWTSYNNTPLSIIFRARCNPICHLEQVSIFQTMPNTVFQRIMLAALPQHNSTSLFSFQYPVSTVHVPIPFINHPYLQSMLILVSNVRSIASCSIAEVNSFTASLFPLCVDAYKVIQYNIDVGMK